MWGGRRVVIIHPDLGIGGAERLIVDTAKALQDLRNDVSIYTGYHDKERCFEETRDGTLKVHVVGGWIPRSLFGRFHAIFAYLRMIYIAIYLILSSNHDVVICDQVSACIPILKLDIRNWKSKIIFYCHFPDQLLTKRVTLLKYLYRLPLDLFEEYSTGLANEIIVNSVFTRSITKATFSSLRNRALSVLYPCVNVNTFVKYQITSSSNEAVKKCVELSHSRFIFLSLNRYESKKNLALAIKAFRKFIEHKELTRKEPPKAHLVIAGGYDERVQDCVQYYEKLENLMNNLELESYVTFIKSPSDNDKLLLLKKSNCIVYTPESEHFGIVPLEAMAMAKPVIACNSGGPLETISDGKTGYLCNPDDSSFADAMLKVYQDRIKCEMMGKAGLERVKKDFSYEAFREEWRFYMKRFVQGR